MHREGEVFPCGHPFYPPPHPTSWRHVAAETQPAASPHPSDNFNECSSVAVETHNMRLHHIPCIR